MRLFASYFIKILAFFSAFLIFFSILALLISQIQNFNKNEDFTFINGNINSNNKIALLKLNGPILNEPSNFLDKGFFNSLQIIYVSEIKKILNSLEKEKVKGLIISINSPGGSVSATYNLHKSLDDFIKKNKIKVFFHTNELLTSGAYWLALSGEKIFANYGSLIGSIGVRGPDWIYFDKPISYSSGLLGSSIETKNGIKKFKNIAGNSKDLYDPYRKPTNDEIIALKRIVNNIYQDFKILVAKKRNIEDKILTEDIGALIFDPKTAKNYFLIDDIIDINETIDKMIDELSFKDFKIIEYKKSKLNFFDELNQIKFLTINNFIDLQNIEICNSLKNNISLTFDKYFSNKNC